MSPDEHSTESTLLKEQWSLIQAGKKIKIKNYHIYLDNQLFGEVINSCFKHMNNQKPHPTTSDTNIGTSDNAQSMDQQPPSPMETH